MKKATRNPQGKKKKPSGAKKNNPWQDHYARRAQKEHYPARSVYKLQEILQKHSLIKKGHKIMDLGCAPGSWLIYAAQLIRRGIPPAQACQTAVCLPLTDDDRLQETLADLIADLF